MTSFLNYTKVRLGMVRILSIKTILIIAGATILSLFPMTEIHAQYEGPGVIETPSPEQNIQTEIPGKVSDIYGQDITETPPAANNTGISLSGLVVSPAEVNPGYHVTINVTVTNIGMLTADCDINLKINNRTISTRKITDLPVNASQTVTFTTGQNRLGTYEVRVGDLKGAFTVIEADGSKAEPINWWLMGFLVVCCLVLLWIILRNLMIQRRQN